MTDKEKARAYDEALEKARQLCAYPTTKSFISDLQDLFPELVESGDEKIRKALIDFFGKGAKNGAQTNGVYDKDILAWLEKQKPANSCKIRKDLQEAKDLTSFELGLLMMLTDTSDLSTIDCVKKHSTALLSTAYIQFLATHRFDEEIESAIKKRCDEIDEDEMASKSGATSPITELWYKKGLSDAKMKIKGL